MPEESKSKRRYFGRKFKKDSKTKSNEQSLSSASGSIQEPVPGEQQTNANLIRMAIEA
jgi:hypothetical protein